MFACLNKTIDDFIVFVLLSLLVEHVLNFNSWKHVDISAFCTRHCRTVLVAYV